MQWPVRRVGWPATSDIDINIAFCGPVPDGQQTEAAATATATAAATAAAAAGIQLEAI